MKFTSAQDISIQAVWPASIPPGAMASAMSSALSVSAMVGVSVGWGSAGAACRCNAGACNSVSHDVKRDGLKSCLREQRPVLPRAADPSVFYSSRCDRDGSDGSAGLFGSMTAARAVATLGQLPRATRPMVTDGV